MPTFNIEQERITAFELDQTYLFKQYFDKDDLFQQLEQHYSSDKYRFEVPEGELSKVNQILNNFIYYREIANQLREHCVI